MHVRVPQSGDEVAANHILDDRVIGNTDLIGRADPEDSAVSDEHGAVRKQCFAR
jgi:hypothetical protein